MQQITAFLFHGGGHDDPAVLRENEEKSFIGSYILGMGFTFDDTNEDATPLAEMQRLIASNPKNGERIFPYIGGEEVNTSPTHAHHRYVIGFGTLSEAEAREGWPDLMNIVETKVKPERMIQKREIRSRYWWRFGESTPALVRALGRVDRVIAIARVSNAFGVTLLPAKSTFSEQLVLVTDPQLGLFALLQSRLHEIWARFFGSSFGDGLRYTPSDCFETFPFPANWQANLELEAVGAAYFEFRAGLMVRNNEGLTKTYNRFHSPDERDEEILKLRELHAAMDRVVLHAYGWDDLAPTSEFLLDYDEPTGATDAPVLGAVGAVSAGPRAKKKPWRLRWPDAVRDEVLARLLALNAQRARAQEGGLERAVGEARDEDANAQGAAVQAVPAGGKRGAKAGTKKAQSKGAKGTARKRAKTGLGDEPQGKLWDKKG